MKEAGYEFKEHTADIQVNSWGKTLEEAFSQTAYGLMAIISPKLEKITPTTVKTLKIKAEDKQALLFDFLSEFLYIFDVEELIFNHIDVLKIERLNDAFELKAVLKGEKFDKQKHEIGTEVKAITYSFMLIEEKKKEVEINVMFDI